MAPTAVCPHSIALFFLISRKEKPFDSQSLTINLSAPVLAAFSGLARRDAALDLTHY